VKAAHGSEPDVLADFGVHPKPRTPPTVEAKAAATAKRAATRAARHTMGARKKAGIKGDVIGVTVVPVTTKQPTVSATSGPNAGATSTGGTAGSTPRAT